eukprot:CAMPEP_0204592492 /NCGR_PEP_ID=MMETSP0661-20131031/50969_1 /ASSEMBLY_ACC=CAM_ASM_000606 /TAXON_ID=109239 /ORGANISM="Alexandrium margalefi, Strain AMGDE01CS-322" /LENGTH=241 /DNA_ID=CAMNT_0051602723 /DNA_START=47 /DNA_END=772 /DNA_ORIENTATION=+
MVGTGLGVVCCVLLSVVGYVGFDAYRLSEVKPCVAEAAGTLAKLKALPAKFANKTAALEDKLTALKDEGEKKYSDLESQAKKAAWSMDLSKARELKDKASAELQEAREKEAAIRGEMDAIAGDLKTETCSDGEAVATDFGTCLGYLHLNLVYLVLNPPGMPTADSVKPSVDSAKSVLSNAGCDASPGMEVVLTAARSQGYVPAALAAGGGASALVGAALAALALAGRRSARLGPLEERLVV